jgi:hypothetical protein
MLIMDFLSIIIWGSPVDLTGLDTHAAGVLKPNP